MRVHLLKRRIIWTEHGFVHRSQYDAKGRPRVANPKKPRYATTDGRRVHLIMAERLLGRPLRWPEQVHHVNGDKLDNSPGNLVICPDGSYHQLLEIRGKALRECGNADWRKCRKCGRWDDPANMKSKEYTYPKRPNCLWVKHWHYPANGGGCGNKADWKGRGRTTPKARTDGIWIAAGEHTVRCVICRMEMDSSTQPCLSHARRHEREGRAVTRLVERRWGVRPVHFPVEQSA